MPDGDAGPYWRDSVLCRRRGLAHIRIEECLEGYDLGKCLDCKNSPRAYDAERAVVDGAKKKVDRLMNAFMFFVDGLLAPPDFFSARVTNTSDLGMSMVMSTNKLVKSAKTVDALEVRSGKFIRRYHKDVSELKFDKGQVVKITCARVPNTTF